MRRERTLVINKSILLVDDSLPNLKLTRFLLIEDGFDVRTAENAEQALLALETRVPDMILMDIQMPGMDGIEATRRIREIPDLAELPIIALTALAMPGDRERCIAAGANDYLSKPISLRGLATMIETHMNHQASP